MSGSGSALATAVRNELAKSSLVEFARLMMPHLNVDAPHFVKVCEYLEAVKRDEILHLVLELPPRHSKTTIVSKLLPAWWLGWNPRDELIVATNTAGLASDLGKDSRNLVQSQDYPFATRVREDSFAGDLWRTTEGGVAKFCGVGQQIQGRGSSLLLVDDPIGSAEEATPLALERQWQWLTQDAFRRLLPGGHAIICMYRWADPDMVGRINDDAELRKQFTFLRLPVYARSDDPLGRTEGALLFPRSTGPDGRPCGFTVEEIEFQRQLNSRSFLAQYMGECSPAEGNIVKREHLSYKAEFPAEFERVVLAIDAAAKTGIQNDFSGLVVVGSLKNEFYIKDAVQVKATLPELRRLTIAMSEKHTQISRIYIESASAGIGLEQDLRANTNLPVVPVKPGRLSKFARLEGTLGALFEARRVHLPAEASWLGMIENQLLRFPAAKNDDVIDALEIALSQLRRKSTSDWNFAFVPNGGFAGALARNLR